MNTEFDKFMNVFTEKSEMSIFEIHRRCIRGDIDINSFYYRKNLWSKLKKSKLIESILRNIPIPALYLWEKNSGEYEVIDGHQRLHTFFDFIENKFSLEQLPVSSGINGKKFKDLDRKYQRKIEDYQLNIYIIKKESHPDIKFDIFERINEGTVRLNSQELRDCTYRGEEICLIKKMCKDEYFIKLTDKKLQTSRKKDEELILRFLSFYAKGYKQYNGSMNSFLNDTLGNFNSYKKSFYNIDEIFKDTMKCIYEIFGENAFCKKNNPNLNVSLFDVITLYFALNDRNMLRNNKKFVIEAFKKVMNNKVFYNAITFNTLSKYSVQNRFKIWNEIYSMR